MFFNQTLKRKIELGSYSVGKIRFFGVALDFAIEPVLFSPSPGNLFESMIGHPPVPGYQSEFEIWDILMRCFSIGMEFYIKSVLQFTLYFFGI